MHYRKGNDRASESWVMNMLKKVKSSIEKIVKGPKKYVDYQFSPSWKVIFGAILLQTTVQKLRNMQKNFYYKTCG